uniref:Arginine decarboxylase n=1 Tax=Physcomitrium patens TaxID=3218 RepID=A0A7I4B0J6_PHYPA
MGSGLLRGGFKLKGFGAEISAPGLRKNACVAQALQSPDAPESLSFFSAGCELSRVGCRFVIGTRLVRQGVSSVARSAWGGGFVGRTSLDDGGGGEVEEEEEEAEWTVQDSDALYRLHGWGAPYFAINVAGHLCVRPSGGTEGRDEVDMMAVIDSLTAQQLQLPVILRFPDILHHRMRELQGCFSSAIAKFGYQRHFEGVFPIKCNPECHLLDQFVEFGFGLEVGSKPELLIALSKLSSRDGALLICNGYKDSVYVENVVLATRLGIRAVIVLEQIEELEEVVACSQRLGIRPIIGVRAKLSTKHNGHWGETSGDKAKFGLTVTQIVSVVYRLRQEGMLDCLKLLHFHIGSQISSILVIKEAMREASHTYCELARMGAPMGYIDVGGGLGIDYDGSKGHSSASVNYNMQNYANDVVAALMDACLLKGVAEPVIVSESGRALASHSSVLVFDVLHAPHHTKNPASAFLDNVSEAEDLHLDSFRNDYASNPQSQDAGEYLLSTFYQVCATLELGNIQEAFNDAKQLRQEASSLFRLGCLSLEQRAQADVLYEKAR